MAIESKVRDLLQDLKSLFATNPSLALKRLHERETAEFVALIKRTPAMLKIVESALDSDANNQVAKQLKIVPMAPQVYSKQELSAKMKALKGLAREGDTT